jgi:hypothetical protein
MESNDLLGVRRYDQNGSHRGEDFETQAIGAAHQHDPLESALFFFGPIVNFGQAA